VGKAVGERLHWRSVVPAFVSILAELSPDDAKVLQYIYGVFLESFLKWRGKPAAERGAEWQKEISEKLTISTIATALKDDITLDVRFVATNLERLSLVGRKALEPSFSEKSIVFPTHFGLVFISACSSDPNAPSLNIEATADEREDA
jgi:hypothetical protein